jgi:hypothetical protein
MKKLLITLITTIGALTSVDACENPTGTYILTDGTSKETPLIQITEQRFSLTTSNGNIVEGSFTVQRGPERIEGSCAGIGRMVLNSQPIQLDFVFIEAVLPSGKRVLIISGME